MAKPMRRTTCVAIAIAMAVLAGGCSGSGDEARDGARVEAAPRGSKPLVVPRSIVQLGDSIASGEGTLYGYTYDKDSDSWTGGDLNAKWPPPYPECHVSPDAYGNKVAKSFDATFHQFACTGASFDSGIAAPMVANGVTRRPAEFGNWDTQTNLNAEYDDADPDLVLVTLGADDVDFSDIVEDCIKNGYKYYWNLAKLECVDGNPGATVQKDFFGVLPALKKDYATLVSWIEARAKAHDTPVPKVVFTTYANPLPATGVKCNDINWLYPDQVQYLTSLLQQMNNMIQSTIKGLNDKNVVVADIEKAYQRAGVDHRWCSDDPWAYGLSIYHFYDPSSFNSLAPFHPTPAGQESIAEAVIATIVDLYNTRFPFEDEPTTSTTATSPPTSGPPTTDSSVPTPPATSAPPSTTTATLTPTTNN